MYLFKGSSPYSTEAFLAMTGILLSQGIPQTSHRRDAMEDSISMYEGPGLL